MDFLKRSPYVDQLEACLERDALQGNASEVTDIMSWFGFDSMVDFTFGKSFGMLKNQHWHQLIVQMKRGLSVLGVVLPVPWLTQIVFRFSPQIGIMKDWVGIMEWCESQMREKIEVCKGPYVLKHIILMQVIAAKEKFFTSTTS